MNITRRIHKAVKTASTVATVATVYNSLPASTRDKVKSTMADAPHQVTGLLMKLKDQTRGTN